MGNQNGQFSHNRDVILQASLDMTSEHITPAKNFGRGNRNRIIVVEGVEALNVEVGVTLDVEVGVTDTITVIPTDVLEFRQQQKMKVRAGFVSSERSWKSCSI